MESSKTLYQITIPLKTPVSKTAGSLEEAFEFLKQHWKRSPKSFEGFLNWYENDLLEPETGITVREASMTETDLQESSEKLRELREKVAKVEAKQQDAVFSVLVTGSVSIESVAETTGLTYPELWDIVVKRQSSRDYRLMKSANIDEMRTLAASSLASGRLQKMKAVVRSSTQQTPKGMEDFEESLKKLDAMDKKMSSVRKTEKPGSKRFAGDKVYESPEVDFTVEDYAKVSDFIEGYFIDWLAQHEDELLKSLQVVRPQSSKKKTEGK